MSLVLLAAAVPAGADEIAELVAHQDVERLRHRGPAVLADLVTLYRSGDEPAKANLAWIFYQLGWKSEEARAALMEDVHTAHQALRIWSQYALGRVSNDDQVVDVLFENMMEKDAPWLFRDKAACSLAYDQIHLTESQKVRLFTRMIRALDDLNGGTRRLAIQVLRVYTGQDKGYRPGLSRKDRIDAVEEWRRWLAEYRSNLRSP